MLHVTDSSAASKELQDAMLLNSIVNLRGEKDTSLETDRLLELLNNSLKAFQHERSYYSKQSDILLQNWALNGPYFDKVKVVVESSFRRLNSDRHPSKSAADDIWSMALHLAPRSLVQKKTDRYSL